jgi:hypothetical protein
MSATLRAPSTMATCDLRAYVGEAGGNGTPTFMQNGGAPVMIGRVRQTTAEERARHGIQGAVLEAPVADAPPLNATELTRQLGQAGNVALYARYDDAYHGVAGVTRDTARGIVRVDLT